jgi:hypothetical protein
MLKKLLGYLVRLTFKNPTISIRSEIWQTRPLIASSPVSPVRQGQTQFTCLIYWPLHIADPHRGIINHTNFTTQKRVHFHNWFTAINCWICLSWGNLLYSSSLEAKAIISFWQIASWNIRVRARNEWPQIFHRRASKLEPRLNDGDHHYYAFIYIQI